ncbi:uncharacterized protein G2W53_004717 [Senna tora]|uniref:Uncharacterized protein n=1 Tax=Senna tora TaxID=362788 RepID=A0A834XDM8_9FABA|nr:uncharacterized protein G2W53_004717 [Senna tora]
MANNAKLCNAEAQEKLKSSLVARGSLVNEVELLHQSLCKEEPKVAKLEEEVAKAREGSTRVAELEVKMTLLTFEQEALSKKFFDFEAEIDIVRHQELEAEIKLMEAQQSPRIPTPAVVRRDLMPAMAINPVCIPHGSSSVSQGLWNAQVGKVHHCASILVTVVEVDIVKFGHWGKLALFQTEWVERTGFDLPLMVRPPMATFWRVALALVVCFEDFPDDSATDWFHHALGLKSLLAIAEVAAVLAVNNKYGMLGADRTMST